MRICESVVAACVSIAALASGAGTARSQVDHYSIVKCGTLLDVAGKPAKKNMTVVVKNGLIDSVVATGQEPKREALPKDAVVDMVDLSDKFVLPGLIDCHVHLTNQWDEGTRLRLVQDSNSLVALRATKFARITLEAGFTTVRDLGARHAETIFALRDGINQGLIVGPRIVASGHPIAVTGGHGDFTNGYRQDVWGDQGEADGIADGPDSCMKAVRNQIKFGADCIKLTATGGVLSASAAGLRQHFTQEELNAIVTAAHMMSRKVAAHAHGVDGIKAALAAGVDSIEHGTYLDDDAIKLFKGHNAYFVPTMLAAETVTTNAEKPGFYLKVVADKARMVGARIKDAVAKAHKAGVKIAFGTDSGVSDHGINAREFSLLVGAGLSPTETLIAATTSAAELLGLSDQIGTIEKGKAADLIAVAGDPTVDVATLMDVKAVMRAGVVVKNVK